MDHATPTPARHTTYERLVELLRQHKLLGFEAWSLVVRTVAFRYQDEWRNYGTMSWLEPGVKTDEHLTQIRDSVALVECRRAISESFTPHALSKTLLHWREALRLSMDRSPSPQIHLERLHSDIRRNLWPGWRTRIGFGNEENVQLPDGPFFDPTQRLFGPDVGRLAVQFLGHSKYGSDSGSRNEYTLRIPDRRARISSLELSDGTLALEVENRANLKLYWSVMATPFAGDLFHTVVDVTNNRAAIELPFRVQRLETWVILPDGYMLDMYEENSHWGTWGAEGRLIYPPHPERFGALAAALESGETDTVEFKPYIKLSPVRDVKAAEILETVSALANTKGGNLFLGVTDSIEVVGVEHALQRDYGKDHPDPQARRDAYVKDVRKLINEGTAPSLEWTAVWLDPELHDVLQITIPRSPGTLVHVNQTGDIYRRAGANNKKWRPIDAMAQAGAEGRVTPAFGFDN